EAYDVGSAMEKVGLISFRMWPNETLDRMTRSAVSRIVQCELPWRAPRHRSACVRRQAFVRVDRESFWCCSFSASLCVLGVSALGFSTQRPQKPRSFAESFGLYRRSEAGPHG